MVRLSKSSMFHSIRFKLMFGLLVVMVPIISLLIYSNFYSMSVVRNQVAQSNSHLLSLYMGQIDRSLEDIDNYLFELIAQEPGLLTMERSNQQDPDYYTMVKVGLFKKLLADSIRFKSLQDFFLYSATNQDLLLVPRSVDAAYSDFKETQLIKGYMNELLQDEAKLQDYPNEIWSSFSINDQYYLVRIVRIGKVYLGAIVKEENIMVPLNFMDMGTSGKSLLANENYEPMNDLAFIKENRINLQYKGTTYMLTGTAQQYLVVGEKSSKGNFSLIALIPDGHILEKLPYLQRIILFIACGLLLYLAVAVYMLRRVVLLPINRIVFAMRKIKEGYLEARIAGQPASNEFELMNETFNSMASQIQQLKIDIYEEQLNHQKAELKQLQLQINPHFFLNSLNMVYYLAQDRNFALIQELSLSLIRYFRFMFRSHSDFVLLQDELKHIQNYLRIQEFRFPGHLSYKITAVDSLQACLIPPLCIQTFVENAIKHAVSMDAHVHIDILIENEDSNRGEGIKIRIQDTGKGFSDHILHQLQEEINPLNDAGEHVGIWNVKRRLRLLYREQANLTFINDHGAVVEIRIPNSRDRGTVECINC
ncbi:sensor histidine kinase [Paenibacillus sp. GCM10027628]|uniref:sensor histidine kinase n=1 Tax=Paenibacillus sp. GCM10027628 TaxID=3273413 RepID=UPI0036362566